MNVFLVPTAWACKEEAGEREMSGMTVFDQKALELSHEEDMATEEICDREHTALA
jgi:hypothetical protein